MSASAEVHDERLLLDEDLVVWRELDGEAIALELQTSTYVSLNESARLLWSQLVEGATCDELVGCLVERYGIDPERAAVDVAQFVATLVERSLVVAAGAPLVARPGATGA